MGDKKINVGVRVTCGAAVYKGTKNGRSLNAEITHAFEGGAPGRSGEGRLSGL